MIMHDDALDVAPSFRPGAIGLPWWRRMSTEGNFLLPSALFLGIPLYYGLESFLRAGFSLPRLVALFLACLMTAGLYVSTPLVSDRATTVRWLWVVGLMVAVVAIGVASADFSTVAYYAAYPSVATALLIAWRDARLLIPVITVAGVAAGAMSASPAFPVTMSLTCGVVAFALSQGYDAARTRVALARAEERTALLAVAAERERIGRDLHDILGHSLTAIAVKADLAERLVTRDAARARAEIADLAAVARQALADVRATASGMREVRLATELAAARSVLAAAGVECVAPSAVPRLDDAASELFGYVVREAVTNVVRHAGAATCTIAADEVSISVADDGVGMPAASAKRGLAGLESRVARAGGTLSVDSSAGGTTVRASLPEVRP